MKKEPFVNLVRAAKIIRDIKSGQFSAHLKKVGEYDRTFYDFLEFANVDVNDLNLFVEAKPDAFVDQLWQIYSKQVRDENNQLIDRSEDEKQYLRLFIRTITSNYGFKFKNNVPIETKKSIDMPTIAKVSDQSAALAEKTYNDLNDYFGNRNIEINISDTSQPDINLIIILDNLRRGIMNRDALIEFLNNLSTSENSQFFTALRSLEVKQLSFIRNMLEEGIELFSLQHLKERNALLVFNVLINEKNQFALSIEPEINKTLGIFTSKLKRFLATATPGGHAFAGYFDALENHDLYDTLVMLARADQLSDLDIEQLGKFKDLEIIDNEAAYKKQLALLEFLYNKFESLAQLGMNNAFLKVLKKRINGFAEKNGFPKQLFSLDKLCISPQYDQEMFNVTNIDAKRVYAYLPGHANYVTKEKWNKRDVKCFIDAVTTASALELGFGEGSVAGYYAPHGNGFRRAVAASGFLVNYGLCKEDMNQSAKELWFNGFKNKLGIPISRTKKCIIGLALSLAFLSGLGFGFLSATALTGIFGIPSIAIATGVFSCIGLTFIFFCGISDFIKNDGFSQIKESLIRKFSRGDESLAYYLAWRAPVQVLGIAASLLITFTAVVFSSVFIGSATVQSLVTTFKMSLTQATHIGKPIMLGPGAISNAFFGAKGIMSAVSKLTDELAERPFQVYQWFRQYELSKALSVIFNSVANKVVAVAKVLWSPMAHSDALARGIYRCLGTICGVSVVGAATLNGIGQQNGSSSCLESQQAFTKITDGFFGPVQAALSRLSTFSNSAAPVCPAAYSQAAPIPTNMPKPQADHNDAIKQNLVSKLHTLVDEQEQLLHSEPVIVHQPRQSEVISQLLDRHGLFKQAQEVRASTSVLAEDLSNSNRLEL